MKITGPLPVAPVAPIAAVNDAHLVLDINLGVFRITYATEHKVIQGVVPAALLTPLRTFVQGRIEVAEGWAPGSSALDTTVTP